MDRFYEHDEGHGSPIGLELACPPWGSSEPDDRVSAAKARRVVEHARRVLQRGSGKTLRRLVVEGREVATELSGTAEVGRRMEATLDKVTIPSAARIEIQNHALS